MNKIVVLIICLFSFVLFSFKLLSVPPSVNGDEVGIARNALLISKNLTDENNNFLPLFIFAKDSDWKQPVTVYTTALVFKIIGSSFWSLRFVSILFVIISLVILYFISIEKYDFKFFLFSSLIFVTTPIILIQSHLALENIAVLPFILFWLLMLLKFEKKQKLYYLILAGVSLGIGLFSYLGMRLFVPILILLSLVILKKDYMKIRYLILGSLPFFILLFISNFYYPNAVVGRYSGASISIFEYLYRYLSIYDLSFLFLKGDVTPSHSTGKAGMFLISTLPLFIFGIKKIIADKKPFEILILSTFFLAPILIGFVPDIYRASRLLVLVPLFVIISSLGFINFSKLWKIIFIIMITLTYAFFVKDYWFDYPQRVNDSFKKEFRIENYNDDFTTKSI